MLSHRESTYLLIELVEALIDGHNILLLEAAVAPVVNALLLPDQRLPKVTRSSVDSKEVNFITCSGAPRVG
jgi:hypothetical protein